MYTWKELIPGEKTQDITSLSQVSTAGYGTRASKTGIQKKTECKYGGLRMCLVTTQLALHEMPKKQNYTKQCLSNMYINQQLQNKW